ncbi:MAG TPA: SGNH/GDSL hydrolase family protein [Oculatellaceae cyanobacterium]|jgi:phospholipase/lecithinase/hemolysin
MLIKKLLIATAGTAISLTAFLANTLTIDAYRAKTVAQNFNEIYVFGDSLSDIGNMSQATQGYSPPSPLYYKGRYSNGLVWVDYLASKLKLTVNKNNDFAYGGATTGNSTQAPLGLLTQIKRFRSNHSSANPKALYIIWAGANDYFRGATDSTTPINNLTLAVKSLSAAGAKNIAVVNLPDLGNLPGTRNSQYSVLLTDVTNKHNSGLVKSLNNLRPQLRSDINIKYIDVNSLYKQAISNPKKFGFKNVTQSCISRSRICANPNEYLFWDGVHPTTAAHKILVESAFSVLQPKPESVQVSNSNFSVPLGMVVGGTVSTGLIFVGKKVI